MKSILARLYHEVDGQDLIEYGLLAALISIVSVGVLVTLGGKVLASYQGFVGLIP